MNRDDLFDIARAAGWRPGAKPTPQQRIAIVAAMRAALTQPDLAQARVHESNTSRPMTIPEAVGALLEELD